MTAFSGVAGISGPVRALFADAGLEANDVERVVRLALDEDLVGGADVTTEAAVPESHESVGDVVARAAGVAAGVPVAATVFDAVLAGRGRVAPGMPDGQRVAPGGVALSVAGPTRALLTAERSALNLLCHLSGVATVTRRFVDAVAGTGATIRDTRKTTPGLRALEKYAVRQGGGSNHRMGLTDQALVKDNHVRAAGGVVQALDAVRAAHPDVACEVECDTVAQVREAVDAGARLVLFDNMSLDEMREAVSLARAHGVATEASGGVTLRTAADVAATGVDYIAVGALTHSAPALDFGLDLR
ncbi:MAG: carboxylating nicotinate-nucleotide diphosphorylase [Streptosporangiaceae bacterium]